MKMNQLRAKRLYAENECNNHPLGIRRRCKEYRDIIDKFIVNTVGTLNRKSSEKIIVEDVGTPEKIRESKVDKAWIPVNVNRVSENEYFSPIIRKIDCHRENASRSLSYLPRTYSNLRETDDMYHITLRKEVELRLNESYRHRTTQNTQSADISVLTDMLPHRGRPVKRRDIDWGIGSHTTPVEMTDEPETNFSSLKGCFSTWAEAYTRASGRPAY